MLIDNNLIFANFPVRFFAYIIDLTIIFLFLLFIRVPMFFISLFSPDIFILKPILFKFSLWHIIIYLLSISYFVLAQYFFNTTLGKKLLNLKIISSKENSKLDFFTLIYRESIGRYLSSLLNIGYIIVLFKKDRQGLHDILSDTYVVYDIKHRIQTSNNNEYIYDRI